MQNLGQRSRLRPAVQFRYWFLWTALAALALDLPVTHAARPQGREIPPAQQKMVDKVVAAADAADGQKDDTENKTTETANKNHPLTKDGLLQKIAPSLDELIELTWQDRQLSLRFLDSQQEIQKFCNAVRQVAGYGGGTSHDGTGGYQASLVSDKLNGFVRKFKQRNRFQTTLSLEEIDAPRRALSIQQNADRGLTISLNAIESGYLLRLRQRSNGSVVIQELEGTSVFAERAENFDAFFREHPQFAEQKLLPLFEHFGLGKLISPYSDEIQEEFISLLSPWQPDELGRARQLTAGLAAKQYKQREAASEAITKSFADHESTLSRAALDRTFSPEIRARLNRIIDKQSSPEAKARRQFLVQMVERQNAAYLLWLMQAQTDPLRRQIIGEALRGLLNIEESADAIAAGDWPTLVASHSLGAWASTELLSGGPNTLSDPLQESGHLQKVAAHTGKLVRLVWRGDQLDVDREHWKKPFGGRDIKDLVKQVEQQIADSQLPPGWFNPGGSLYTIQSAQHPQVLFEHLQVASGKEHSGPVTVSRSYYNARYAGNNTPNRLFENGALKGRLQFEKPQRNRSSTPKEIDLSGKPFLFSLSEVNSPERTVYVHEPASGQLQLRVQSEASDFIMQLVQSENGALVQYVRGSQVIAYQAATFRQLQDAHPEFFRDQFFPLLRHLGISVADDVSAPPEANQNTTTSSSSDFS